MYDCLKGVQDTNKNDCCWRSFLKMGFLFSLLIFSGQIFSIQNSNQVPTVFAENLNGAGLSGPYYKKAGINWNVLLHSLDLALGRSITIDDFVNLSPFVGLKGSVIKQSLKINWQRPFEQRK